MSLRKVYGGTRTGTESLCDTCRNAGIIQGYAESERIVICGRRDEALRVPFNVAECSDYDDKRQPVLWELKQIAWEVRAQASTPKSGFVLASDLEKKQDGPQKEIQDPAEAPAVAAVTK